MNETKLTTCIFAYNHENYIARTIQSVLDQKTTFKYNIIIVDDCSTDGTPSIITDFASKYSDVILPILHSENKGLNESFIEAMLMVKTKYCCILGGDDYWCDKEKLEKQIKLLETDSTITFVHTGYVEFDESRNCNDITHNEWQWNMPQDITNRIGSVLANFWSYFPLASSSCFVHEILLNGLKNNIYLIRNECVGEGMLLCISQCLYGKSFGYINDVTTVYTVRKNSLSHHSDMERHYRYYSHFFDLKILLCERFSVSSDWLYKVYNSSLLSMLNISVSANRIDWFKTTINNVPQKILSRLDIRLRFWILYGSYLSTKGKCKNIINTLLSR